MMENYTLFLKRKGIIITLVVMLLTATTAATTYHFFFKSWVTAQVAGRGLEISPPSQEVSIDPGATIKVKAKIANRSNDTLPMSVHIEDFTATGDQGQVALSQGGTWSVVSWTTVSPQKFSLKPQEEQEVTATISVPKNAAGGRYGSFVFAVTPETTPGQNAAIISQQIASLFLVRISGPVNENITLSSLSAPTFQEFGPVPLNLQFQNKGNVHVKTYGLINVRDIFGNKVADIVVPGTNIFPQAQRTIQASLQKIFLFGPYTATALMYYGSDNQVVNATTTFWVFPVRIIAGALIVLIIIFLLRKRLTKSLRTLLKG